MNASERYELTLAQFIERRSNRESITLRDFCIDRHINYPAMTAWLSRKGISLYDINPLKFKITKERNSTPILPKSLSNQTFAPIHPQESISWRSDELSGISITFPDGICVTIKQASVNALTDFINNYNSEAV
ncbi:MAG: hypothetical protein ACRCZM_05300 [Bacteroidales bacterium]